MAKFKIKKILVPLDFSFTSLKALDHAITLSKLSDAELILMHVVENQYVNTDPFFVSSPGIVNFENKLTKASKENLDKLASKIKKKGIDKIVTVVVNGRTHKQILKVVKTTKPDLIVMGTHGVSGVKEFVMGSNTFRIVSDAECPVLSVRRKSNPAGFKNILVPFCDRPHSRDKVIYAIKMAEIYNSKIYVYGVDTDKTSSHRNKVYQEADQISDIVERYNIECDVKVVSAPYDAETILRYAQKIKADLILSIGDIIKQDITEYFTGSFAQQVINHSSIPVLSIHSEVNTQMVEMWHGI